MLIDGISLNIPPPDRHELGAVFHPLAGQLQKRLAALSDERRFLMGICGPPGSGKTVLAHRWIEFLYAEELFASDEIVHVSMDGYHYSNQYLDATLYQGNRYSGFNGKPLRSIKGAPESFDVRSFLQDVHRCLEQDEPVYMPAYCRQAHEPIPNRIQVTATTRLIVLDGNYLALNEPDWKDLPRLLDLIIFLDASREQCIKNLIARHTRGGRAAEDAREFIYNVDLVNFNRVVKNSMEVAFRIEANAYRLQRLVPSGRQDSRKT